MDGQDPSVLDSIEKQTADPGKLQETDGQHRTDEILQKENLAVANLELRGLQKEPCQAPKRHCPNLEPLRIGGGLRAAPGAAEHFAHVLQHGHRLVERRGRQVCKQK